MNLSLPPHSKRPLYEQIAEEITTAIECNRLQPGQKIPGSRTLASQLQVHRNTVLAAYDDLIAQGWLETRPKQGTYVCEDLPTRKIPFKQKVFSQNIGFPLHRARFTFHPQTEPGFVGLDLSGGVPDLRYAPTQQLGQSLRRVLKRPNALSYGDSRGQNRLRHQLALLLNAQRGLSIQADDIIVTQGSQGALHCIASTLLSPGDVVVVGHLGYRPAWDSFKLAGATLLFIPIDDNGLDTEQLATLLRSQTIRAVYITPHHQYPTMVVLSATRRLQLLALAKRHRFAIIEDDYDNEVHYRGRPVLPLAANDRDGVVLYIGTLSKTLAPGLRIGYIVAPRTFLTQVQSIRYAIDRHGCSLIELAIADLLEDGTIQRHARKMKRIYLARRNRLVEELQTHFANEFSFSIPSGGLALWVRSQGIDLEAWASAARKKGLLFLTEKHYRESTTPSTAFRLGYASSEEAELLSAIKILKRTMPKQ